LIGPPEDNMQDFWNVWYAAVARNPDQFFFTNLIRFPEGTQRWSHFLTQPAKVGSPMQRTTHHEDAETVFG